MTEKVTRCLGENKEFSATIFLYILSEFSFSIFLPIENLEFVGNSVLKMVLRRDENLLS